MQTNALILSSSKLCPYGIRCLALLAESGLSYQLEEVPEGASGRSRFELSPTGLLPVLRCGEAVVFESAAICDFILHTSENTIPFDRPLDAALARSWASYASHLYPLIKGAVVAGSEAEFEAARAKLAAACAVLEKALRQADAVWQRTPLCEAAFFPFLSRLAAIDRQLGTSLLDCSPVFRAWAASVLVRFRTSHPWVVHHGEWFLDHFRQESPWWLVKQGTAQTGSSP
jgi:glutathione S-transferase